MDYSDDELQVIAKELRKKIIKMICRGGGGHIAPAFSVVEILVALYFGVMRYDPGCPDWPERDRLILSKGHASAALYAVLAQAGFFQESLLDTFCRPGSILGGHPDMHKVPGVEASTGALGHGFPFAVGIALAGKMDQKDYRVFAILGDGECQEGTVWEAALFASHHRLGRLTTIVDYNKLQAMDRLDGIVKVEPFAEKWRAFGWDVFEVDGHDVSVLISVLGKGSNIDAPPRLVLAHTVKGKGVSFMENAPLWHYRLPNEEEMNIVRKELGF
jgi:transketolase